MTEATASPSPETTKKKVPLLLRVFGVLFIISGILSIPADVIAVVALVVAALNYDAAVAALGTIVSTQALVLFALCVLAKLVLSVMFVIFGIRLVRNKRRESAIHAGVMIGFAIAVLVLDIMTDGIKSPNVIYDLVILVFLTVTSVALDPSLRQERLLQRHLKTLDEQSDLEEGVLGRDKTGEGYLSLNFFNIFWIFVIASVLGLVMESIYCPIVDGGVYENRTGLLWGPFSPIYGVGAVLMTVALNRFYDKPKWMIFLFSALIGGVFEFAVSWFFQFAFGITSWDYSDKLLNIAGRTDAFHMAAWGVLGLWFIRSVVPWLLDLINRIPIKWRHAVTTVFAAFMIFDAGMSLLAFDCWFERSAGNEPDTPMAQFFADNYGDEFMENHFQSMTMHPESATRK